MSGGHFDYRQFQIDLIADEIKHLIETNDFILIDHFGDKGGRNYSKETMDCFQDALVALRKASLYTQRIDWLVSGDDSEETFHTRLKQELDVIDKDSRT